MIVTNTELAITKATEIKKMFSCYAIAFQFSQCVVTSVTAARIPKPELFNWQMCLVSEETAVFTPYIVILITVTTISWVCTWVGHPACALTTTRWCSTPVRHLTRITWHPPGICSVPSKHHWVMTLVLDKLLTVGGDAGETRQLRETSSCVMNITWVTTPGFKTIYVRSAFTVVTDHCHANSIFITHVTVYSKWCQAPRAIWINDVISTYTTAVCSDLGTGRVYVIPAFDAIPS